MGSGSGTGGGDGSEVLAGAGGGEGAVPRGLVASAKSQSVNEGSQMSAPITTRDVRFSIDKTSNFGDLSYILPIQTIFVLAKCVS